MLAARSSNNSSSIYPRSTKKSGKTGKSWEVARGGRGEERTKTKTNQNETKPKRTCSVNQMKKKAIEKKIETYCHHLISFLSFFIFFAYL